MSNNFLITYYKFFTILFLKDAPPDLPQGLTPTDTPLPPPPENPEFTHGQAAHYFTAGVKRRAGFQQISPAEGELINGWYFTTKQLV